MNEPTRIENWRERWEEKDRCGNKVVEVWNGQCGTMALIVTAGGAGITGEQNLIPKPQPKKWVPWTKETFPWGEVVWVRLKNKDVWSLLLSAHNYQAYFNNYERRLPDGRIVPCGVEVEG